MFELLKNPVERRIWRRKRNAPQPPTLLGHGLHPPAMRERCLDWNDAHPERAEDHQEQAAVDHGAATLADGTRISSFVSIRAVRTSMMFSLSLSLS